MTLFTALPDALVALWLELLANGVARPRPHARSSSPASASRSRRPRRGTSRCCSTACSVASATASASRSSRTSRGCRRRWRPSSTRNDPSTSTGSRCCAIRSSRSTTCSCRSSRPLGWVLRLVVTVVLLVSIHPALVAARRVRAPDRDERRRGGPASSARPKSAARRTTGSRATCSCSARPRRPARRSASPASAPR